MSTPISMIEGRSGKNRAVGVEQDFPWGIFVNPIQPALVGRQQKVPEHSHTEKWRVLRAEIVGALKGLCRPRRGAGTFVTSKFIVAPGKALLIFNRRAQRGGSFGDELLHRLEAHLASRGIPFESAWHDAIRSVGPGHLPVAWEAAREIVEQTALARRFALMVNSSPAPGLQATWVDSVAVDDFSGGVCAAQILAPFAWRGKTIVLGGPKNDFRSQGRIAGFCSVIRNASALHAGTWFAEEAGRSALAVARSGARAVFCCNDLLAQAVLFSCSKTGFSPPKLVGFDDAPIARELGLSTVALPWEGLVQTTADRILKRLSGDAEHAARILLAPRPVCRASA
ncbi:MAG: substrate-binding domain-containing protein [Terrimicrobiaceae bacterium]|nr:substrate-binding domain-containing protein [Terrimicrobiaceae bacterium]